MASALIKETAAKLESEIKELREILAEKERKYMLTKENDFNIETNKYNEHLSNREISRYSRQIFLLNNCNGQVQIKEKSVLLIGCGSLGCVCALYLVGAGVGKLGIVDNGFVKTGCLHGQIVYEENDIGKPIVTAAYDRLRRYFLINY